MKKSPSSVKKMPFTEAYNEFTRQERANVLGRFAVTPKLRAKLWKQVRTAQSQPK